MGVLLFYARAVDSTMLVSLESIATAQAKITAATAKATTQLLNYATSNPDAIIRFRASDMILHTHSDASYLSELKARSRAGGYHYMGSTLTIDTNTRQGQTRTHPPNGAVLVHSTIMPVVLSSATEAATGALFYNANEAVQMRTTLEELGHNQPATPIQCDNTCAVGIFNHTVKQ